MDVAHFIKLAAQWIPLKTISRRAKEVILRTIGQIIKCQHFKDLEHIVLSLFVVLTNETDGYDTSSNMETPCEKHKKKLIEYTSTGKLHLSNYQRLSLLKHFYILGIFDSQLESIIVNDETESGDRTWMEEGLVYEPTEDNPFQKWAETIFEKSKKFVHEGNGINAMYLPSLIPILIKSMKLLPLWSGIMISVFGYGSETASSAAVESSFKKLKNLTFKSATLPVSIEEFLEQHISSLRGVSLIHSTKIGFGKTSETDEDNTVDTRN